MNFFFISMVDSKQILPGQLPRFLFFWEKWWEKQILIGKIIFTPKINLKSTSLKVKTFSQQLYCLTMTLLKLLGFSKHMYVAKMVKKNFRIPRISFDKSRVIYGLYEHYLKIICFFFLLWIITSKLNCRKPQVVKISDL
jgi:hypothetical protein